ncbi:MAG: hypothetical protein ACRD3D_05420 [Terriglobia bacterium]
MKLKLLLLFCVVFVVCQAGYSQAWSGILDPGRAIDWTTAGVVGGMPTRTMVCATVAPSGLTDATDATAINNAIADCAPNEVVQLESGTYTLSAGLIFRDVSNVTLRGAGPARTILKFTGRVPCGEQADLCIIGNNNGSSYYAAHGGGSTTWTGDNGVAGQYNKGDSVIDFGTTSGLSVGQLVNLDQRDDSIGLASASYSGNTVTIVTSIPNNFANGSIVAVGDVCGSTDNSPNTNGYTGFWTISVINNTTFTYINPNLTSSDPPSCTNTASQIAGYASQDNGGVFVSNVRDAFIVENNSGLGRKCPDTSGNASCLPGEYSWRSQDEVKTIAAIDGNQVTISPPIYMPNFRTANAPGVWWTGPNPSGDGVEALTADATNDGGGSNTATFEFMNATNSWLKNIRGINSSGEQVMIVGSTHVSVVDSYFFGTKRSAEESYGVDSSGSADNLIQNSIFQHVDPGVITEGDYGSVFAYNYFIDEGYYSSGWLLGEINTNHGTAGYELYEGNDADNASADNIHGMSAMQTLFRNRLRGQDTPLRTNDLFPINIASFQRADNVVGNVLGTPQTAMTGGQIQYQDDTTNQNAVGDIYFLGINAAEGTGPGTHVPNDPVVSSSLLRWGNYDVVMGAARWCGDSSDPGWVTACNGATEIPAASIPYGAGNAVPASTTLPASFYLQSQPAFWETNWGTPAWPAIGPDVTGGTAPDGVAGHSFATPAQLCYMHTPVDPAYQQTFTVKGATWSSPQGGTATLTIGSNSLAAPETVTVSGVSPAGYNGTFSVITETSNTITYALPTNPGNYASGGSVTWPNILLFDASNCYPSDYGNPPAPPSNLMVTPH